MNLESGYLSAMRAEYRRLTGTLPGEDSDIGIRMALLANQLELLEEELTALKRSADPETAEGAMLDRHADSRGLRRKEAAAATGMLRFRRKGAAAQEILLPQGLVAATTGAEPVRFITTEAGRIAAGETEALIPAQRRQCGSRKHHPAGDGGGRCGGGGKPPGLFRRTGRGNRRGAAQPPAGKLSCGI